MIATRTYVLTALLCLFGFWTQGQMEVDSDLAAAKLKKMASHAESSGDAYTALKYYDAYVEKRPEDWNTWYHMAELYDRVRNYDEARQIYHMVFEKKPQQFKMALYNEARMQKMLGKYPDARANFVKFQNIYKKEDQYKALKPLIEAEIAGCDSAATFIDKALNVDIQRLPNTINQGHIEFSPVELEEGKLLYGSFPESDFGYYHVDSLAPTRKFFLAEQVDDTWVPLGEAEGELNSSDYNTGNGALSPDGNRLYFSKCQKNWKGQMICDLWVAEKAKDRWVNAKSLGEHINDGHSNSMPAVGIETKRNKEVIYFVSDRPGGRGGQDIWYTIYNDKKDEYKAPKNAGSKLNTAGNEVTPYFNLFDHKLYFSSDGYAGLGGLDVFSTRGDQRKWTTPVNVGYPINSSADDLYYTVSKDNDSGFFVSNRKGGNQLMHETCCDDIYRYDFLDYIHLALEGMIVEIDEETYLEGSADQVAFNFDLADRTLKDAQVVLLVKDQGEYVPVENTLSSKRGTYFLNLESDQNYRLMVSKEGYFNNHVDFSTLGITHSDTLVQHIGLSKLNPEAIVIKNIYYEFDKSDLTAEALKTIDNSLLGVLEENPTLKVEIGSHTDSRGEDEYNRTLSQKRAESVVNYLILSGIDPSRLVARGYGEAQPIAPNQNDDGSDNPDGRARNRRTEFRIIGEVPGLQIIGDPDDEE
ncbi:MAG: OmpA family protein [Flavobacteriales bacterium]|nr:OmpA family protein [Flavobacteriales bacterium]